MNTRWLLAAVISTGLLGCSNSCETLAELSCAQEEVEAVNCREQRETASNAGARSQRVCDRALMLLRSLEQH